MDYLVPWPTVIGRTNIADQIDLESLANETLHLNLLTNGEDDSQRYITAMNHPLIIDVRDRIITPLIKEYCLEQWEFDLQEFRAETNGKWIPEGEGLYPHLHPGSCLSAIVYPSDAVSGINLFDPRGNASRGYPKAIRRNNMKAVSISPKAGDVLLVPSYVQHSVSHVQDDVRLSLLFEYYFGGAI